MSIREITWALSQRDVGPIEKFTLVAMGDNSFDGEWSGSIDSLSDYTNIDKSAVPFILDALEEKGLIRQNGAGYTLACGPEPTVLSTRATKQPIPKALRMRVFQRDGLGCLRCGSDDPDALRADHIIPESKGGLMTLDNLQTLCAPCNSWKGVKTIDFRAAP